MIEKVISGGQRGADIAALRAAKLCGVPTGGWMPHKYRTLDGNMYHYAEEFGMYHTSDPEYRSRTIKNVMWGDGTLIVAYNLNSYGEQLTVNQCRKLGKPYFWKSPDVAQFMDIPAWIEDNDIRILNVAGSSARSIETYVERLVTCILKGG